MDRLKSFLLVMCLAVVGTIDAKVGYSYEELEKRIYTHPNTSRKEINRYLAAARKKQQQLEVGKAYFLLGKLYSKEARFVEAANSYKQSLVIFRRQDNEALEMQATAGIGIIYLGMENFGKAISYQRKTLDYQLRKGTPLDKAEAYLNIGCTKACLSEVDSALYFYRQAESLYRKIHNKSRLTDLYLLTGHLYLAAGNPDLALNYEQKALTEARASDDEYTLVAALYTIGTVYKNTGNTTLAKQYFREAFDLAERTNSLVMKTSICQELAELYNSQDSLELAHTYLQELFLISDTLLTIKKIHSINKILFSVEKKPRSSQAWVVLLPVSLLLTSAPVLYFRSRRKRRKSFSTSPAPDEPLEEELGRLQKELVSKSMKIHQQSGLIEWTKSSLKNLHLSNGEEKKVERILSELKSKHPFISWTEFERHFSDMHPDFYNSLLTHYPQLTMNERRLCGLISLNLSNKEISEITRKSIRSIEVAKYRLRTRMGIGKDQQLSAKLAEYL